MSSPWVFRVGNLEIWDLSAGGRSELSLSEVLQYHLCLKQDKKRRDRTFFQLTEKVETAFPHNLLDILAARVSIYS